MKSSNRESHATAERTFTFVPLIAVVLLCALAGAAAGDPLAKPADAEARAHLTAGNRLYRVREFAKAIDEYKAGALREDAPVFYYNLGQCYRQLGRSEDALWHYERFLQRGKPTGELEAAVKGFIAQMTGELEKAKQPPIEPTSPSTAIPANSAIPAIPGQVLPTSLPPAEGRHGMPLQRKIAIGVGITGIAVVGLGVAFGLRSQSSEDDAAEICPMSSCARADEANELIERGKMNARYANVAFGIGGAATVGAAVLWILGSPTAHKETAFAPRISRGFAGIAALRRF